MDLAETIAALKTVVPEAELQPAASVDQPTLLVSRESLLAVARALHDEAALGYVLLSDVTAVDWWPNEPRFDVVYHLASLDRPARLRLKVALAGEDAHLPSVKPIWAGADWLEREVWDLFGIVFDGHGDLRRLMMPEDWEGHPLRKDYPVQIRMKPKVYEPLQLTEQEFQANLAKDRVVRSGRTETAERKS